MLEQYCHLQTLAKFWQIWIAFQLMNSSQRKDLKIRCSWTQVICIRCEFVRSHFSFCLFELLCLVTQSMPLDKPCWFYISAATVTTYALIFHSQCFVNSSSQRLSSCRCQSRDVYIFGNETFHFTKPWKLDMNHVPCMWGKTLYTATKLINVLLLHTWQCGTNLVPRHPSQFSKAVWAWD